MKLGRECNVTRKNGTSGTNDFIIGVYYDSQTADKFWTDRYYNPSQTAPPWTPETIPLSAGNKTDSPRMGWICPVCKKGISPELTKCNCQ